MEIIFLFHLCLAGFMTGVSWFVQLVHYPTLLIMNREQFQQYNEKQFKPTSFITFPFMLMELISGVWLLVDKPTLDLIPFFAINVGFIGLIWVSTMMVQMPLHFKISKYPSTNALKKLVRTNWIRTSFWTLKILIMSYAFVVYILR